MIIENEPRQNIYKEIYNNFGEWVEMGFPVEEFAISMLLKEREKNEYLEKKVKFLEFKVYS